MDLLLNEVQSLIQQSVRAFARELGGPHMRRLREKLGAAAKYLDTVRGVGYRFATD